MGLSTKLNTLLQNPLVETIINLIKKLKSSKSYWSVSYLILLFTLREAIAWKFGSAIQEFCETQATDSAYPLFWDITGFVFDVGGSIELVILGVFIFLVLSIVKVSESENGSVSPKENYLTIFLILFVIGISIYDTKEIQSNQLITHQKLDLLLKKIPTEEEQKEKFLLKYFGKDYKIILNNPTTFHNFTTLLTTTQKTPNQLLEERKELLKKIKNQSLEDSIKKMIDEAFKELRYDDVRTLLDKFIKDNKNIYNDIIKAHYLKALSYIEEIKYHEARKEFEKIGINSTEDTDILDDYAIMYHTLGEYNKAIEFHNQSLTIKLATLEKKHPSKADTYNYLGTVWSDKGDYDKAIEFYNKALNIKLATLGEKHPSIAILYMNLGNVWNNKGDYDKAIELYNKSLLINLFSFGEYHTITTSLYLNLGNAWSNKGNYDKAIKLYNKSLTIVRVIHGEHHPTTASIYGNLGLAWDSKRDYNKSIEYYNQDLTIRHTTLGENHPSTAITYNNLGLAWNNQGDYDKAIEFYNKALSIQYETIGQYHPHTAITYNNLGWLSYNQKKYTKAIEFYSKALTILQPILGKNHPNIKVIQNNIEMATKN